jgi:hypothetical protein
MVMLGDEGALAMPRQVSMGFRGAVGQAPVPLKKVSYMKP